MRGLPSRRTAFLIWDAILVLVFGVGAFGLTVLVIGWFESLEGVAGPVTELGHGALVGIILTRSRSGPTRSKTANSISVLR